MPRKVAGQTLVMALFVLGILLIVGFVFIAVINQTINRESVARQRSAASDLADAGIRFAHNQLLMSVQGADYRLSPTGPLSPRDPDADLLRLDPDGNPANGDQGGPDGLGAYSRVNFSNGRALVRVRYAPSDPAMFVSNPSGALSQPTKANSYLIIESIGKVGRVNPNDPTTVLGADKRESRKLIGFVSIGMLESALYIHDKDRSNRPAEIGYPRPLGARTESGAEVLVNLILGDDATLYNFGNPPTPTGSLIPGMGGIYSNASLMFHGAVTAKLNTTLGEGIFSADRIMGADNQTTLNIQRSFWNPGTGQWEVNNVALMNNSNPSLNSSSGVFSTANGSLRDGSSSADASGFPRGTPRKEAPLISRVDPATNRTRFEELTRLSGALGPSGNDGRFGHGEGPYINNSQDVQLRRDEDGRIDMGSAESLIRDWFNPNSGLINTGWQGPYYIPRGAYVQLLSDGFIIQRDSKAEGNERTWRRPDGSNTGSTLIRYRIGDPDGVGPIRQPYIVNTFTPGVNINDPVPNYSLGRPFNGVLMFEGNVRIRGTIPTDLQLTLVSNATIYVEGSITKGIVGNDWTSGDPVPANRVSPAARAARPSRSMLMLMAREYVAINPTMFFGPSTGQALEEVNESPGAVARNPVRVRVGGNSFNIRAELLLDSNAAGANPLNPTTWTPFAWGPGGTNGYREFGTGDFIDSSLLLSHTMDDGPAPFTFMSMDVNFGLGTPANPSTYLFGIDPVFPYNSASGQGPYAPGYVTPGFSTPNFVPIYGLGSESWQRYPKFESVAFPLVTDTGTAFAFPFLSMNSGQGRYRFLPQETNDLSFRHNNVGAGSTNDWLVARTAIVPHDVRIEAALYAEEGSFVVIPGNWFNPNPNDTWQNFENRLVELVSGRLTPAQARLIANQERRENFGSHPEMPFYGEPLDVRISIVGSITQNMPLPSSQQAEWLRKWGWIPRFQGSTNRMIPARHVPNGIDITQPNSRYVPNLFLIHDPALATGRTSGFDVPVGSDTSPYIRRDFYGRPLPPMPRLPVSPTLSYYGEVLR